MPKRLYRSGCIAVLASLAAWLGAEASVAAAKPIFMPTLAKSLWSNEAAAGTGYCAGAGTDLPAE